MIINDINTNTNETNIIIDQIEYKYEINTYGLLSPWLASKARHYAARNKTIRRRHCRDPRVACPASSTIRRNHSRRNCPERNTSEETL